MANIFVQQFYKIIIDSKHQYLVNLLISWHPDRIQVTGPLEDALRPVAVYRRSLTSPFFCISNITHTTENKGHWRTRVRASCLFRKF